MNLAHAFWYSLWIALAAPCLAPWLVLLSGLAAARFRAARALAFAALIGVLGAWSASQVHAPLLRELGQSPAARAPARFLLYVLSDPEPRGDGEIFLCREAGWHAATEARILHGRPAGLAPGAWVEASGEVEAISGRRNPGGPDFAALARGRGVRSRLRVRSADDVRLVRAGPVAWAAASAWRDSLRGELGRTLGPRAAPIGIAMLFGETSAIPLEQRDGLVALGIIHIAIVAGLHLHMCHAMARAATSRLPRSLSAGLSLGAALGYGWLTGMHLPARRVLWSLGLGELARARGAAQGPRVGAALAAAILLLLEPWRASDPSYVLTVAATWAIHEIPLARPGRGVGKPALDLLRASGLAQMGALAALPFTIGRGSWVSLAANLAAVPAAASLLFLELCGVVFNVILPGTGRPLWLVARLPARLLSQMADAGGEGSWGGLSLRGTPTEWILGYACGLIILAHGPRRWRAAGWIGCAAFAGIMAMGPRDSPGAASQLRLAFLDVGQGDACLITFPSGQSVMVDGGPARPDWDAGRQVVRPALEALGVGGLEWAACSHSDNDHAGGLAALCSAPGAAQWILPPDAPGARWDRLERAMSRAGRAHRRILRGWQWLDATGRDTVRCLYPDSESVAAGLSENNLCLVLEVATPSGRVLLPGDLEAPGEERLLRLPGLRPCAVLKVGHHGSRTSSTPELLSALGGPVAVISVGLRNSYHHPSPEVEERLRERGCVLHETRFEGAVLLGLGPAGVQPLREQDWEGVAPTSGPPKPVP